MKIKRIKLQNKDIQSAVDRALQGLAVGIAAGYASSALGSYRGGGFSGGGFNSFYPKQKSLLC